MGGENIKGAWCPIQTTYSYIPSWICWEKLGLRSCNENKRFLLFFWFRYVQKNQIKLKNNKKNNYKKITLFTLTETLVARPSWDLRKPFSIFLPSLSLFSDFLRIRSAVCHDNDFLRWTQPEGSNLSFTLFLYNPDKFGHLHFFT